MMSAFKAFDLGLVCINYQWRHVGLQGDNKKHTRRHKFHARNVVIVTSESFGTFKLSTFKQPQFGCQVC